MHRLKSLSAILLVVSSQAGYAQTPETAILEPRPIPFVGRLLGPFHGRPRIVAPPKLSNTARLESLVRGGNLYLSVQDVIALVLENNLDIAIQRYGPYLYQEVLRRAQGGGQLRSADTPIAPGPVSVSLAGVSVNTSGLASGAAVGSGGGILIQLGPTPPSLDPYLFAYTQFSHFTTPQSNTILNQTTALTDNQTQIQFGYGQSFMWGMNAQLSYGSTRNRVNSPAYLQNPYTTGYLDLSITQPILQGFSVAVNNRNIRVAKNNLKVSDLQFRRQVVTTISAALNLYWDLVSFTDDLRVKEQAIATAEKLLADNKTQVQLGTLPSFEVTRAAAEVSSTKEDLLISQTNVAQQETVLKNALSRNGVTSAWLDEVHIIPVDHIVVPETEQVRPAGDLIDQALAKRPEIEQLQVNLESSQINLAGTRNSLLPTLNAFVDLNNAGLTGPVNPLAGGSAPNPYLIGGYSNLVAQIFRRNYPNYSIGFSLNVPFRNRVAQADLVMDELNQRKDQLQLQKATNQVRVEVKNALIGLQQARARYETTVATRVLAQQTLEAEQNRFKFGESTIALVVQAQRDLTADQSAEIQSMANYTHAKIAFDDATGQTLDVNRISMEEAASGRVARVSAIPETLPVEKK